MYRSYRRGFVGPFFSLLFASNSAERSGVVFIPKSRRHLHNLYLSLSLFPWRKCWVHDKEPAPAGRG